MNSNKIKNTIIKNIIRQFDIQTLYNVCISMMDDNKEYEIDFESPKEFVDVISLSGYEMPKHIYYTFIDLTKIDLESYSKHEEVIELLNEIKENFEYLLIEIDYRHGISYMGYDYRFLFYKSISDFLNNNEYKYKDNDEYKLNEIIESLLMESTFDEFIFDVSFENFKKGNNNSYSHSVLFTEIYLYIKSWLENNSLDEIDENVNTVYENSNQENIEFIVFESITRINPNIIEGELYDMNDPDYSKYKGDEYQKEIMLFDVNDINFSEHLSDDSLIKMKSFLKKYNIKYILAYTKFRLTVVVIKFLTANIDDIYNDKYIKDSNEILMLDDYLAELEEGLQSIEPKFEFDLKTFLPKYIEWKKNKEKISQDNDFVIEKINIKVIKTYSDFIKNNN